MQAAHVVLERRPRTARQGLWPWIEQASQRLHRNMLAIALANKLARIAWAVLARGHAYQPRITANAWTKARSGPPRGCQPPLSATIAHPIGRASDGGSEGMASPDPSNIKKSNPTETEYITIDSFPTEVCEME